MKNLSLIKRAGLTAALTIQVGAVSCFAALLHDISGPRAYSASTVSNLALAALILPGVAALPLMAAGKASDQLKGLA